MAQGIPDVATGQKLMLGYVWHGLLVCAALKWLTIPGRGR